MRIRALLPPGALTLGLAVVVATAAPSAADPAPSPTPTPTPTASSGPRVNFVDPYVPPSAVPYPLRPQPGAPSVADGTETPADVAADPGADLMAARGEPRFQMPFPCGQAWTGDARSSSRHRTSYEIDFNRGNGPAADRGDEVVAAAAGRVVTAAHQGNANGFGNLVVIDHGGGWRTYYAHLHRLGVRAGQTVAQGQRIGEVGGTTRPGNSTVPHLHYEVRASGSYPGNIRAANFDGRRFPYPVATVTSKNCGDKGKPKPAPPKPAPPKPGQPGQPNPGQPAPSDPKKNPYTPQIVCGPGYRVIDSAALGDAGRVYLLYSDSTGHNCVVTLKSGAGVGKASATSAFLEVQKRSTTSDTGQYLYYAGPVRAHAPKICVRWGGSIGSQKYSSSFEHCG
ncbi:M23 family metallopeptidase [Bailinhaonella thermotolerans]|uniref:M23 family metallopeptidase n=1 Tax=Bailinhaonella thermotolerans TaxID=1070861 RepID=A0A3A4AVC3_9ACTN|nr:M23 family metallopeptidase [Bailinhaonella thermotolerans]RJL30027.1 M23 family metallopeptidase [Bailinhaonella thermotolerans]